MSTRFVLIAVIALASEPAFAAVPAKPVPQAQPQQAPHEHVLASADEVGTSPAIHQQAPSPPKRRIGRVTTCRCGDQAAQPEQ